MLSGPPLQQSGLVLPDPGIALTLSRAQETPAGEDGEDELQEKEAPSVRRDPARSVLATAFPATPISPRVTQHASGSTGLLDNSFAPEAVSSKETAGNAGTTTPSTNATTGDDLHSTHLGAMITGDECQAADITTGATPVAPSKQPVLPEEMAQTEGDTSAVGTLAATTTASAQVQPGHSQRRTTPGAVDATPSPREAARRLNKFTAEVQRKRQPPLIASPPKQKAPPKKPIIPLGSRRIAAQQMGHIPASKRGEVLLMKKMGVLPPQAPPSSATNKEVIRRYLQLQGSKLSASDVEALDVMFPAARAQAGRASGQPTAVVA